MHRSFRASPVRVVTRALANAVPLLAAWSCGRTIEEEEPRELVDHRIEPCRQWCDAMQSPDCGRIDEPQPYESAEECTEDCAAVDPEYPSEWAPQPDGTDACTEEWYAVAACFDGLTCEEQRSYFRRETSAYPPGFACADELEARSDCYYAMRDEQEGAT